MLDLEGLDDCGGLKWKKRMGGVRRMEYESQYR